MAERFENVNSVAHRWKRPASLPSDLDFVLGSRLRAYLANCLTAVDRRNDSLPMDTIAQPLGLHDAGVSYGEIGAAAHAADVTRNTHYEWLKQPQFQSALKKGKAAALSAPTETRTGHSRGDIDTFRGCDD